MAHFPTGGDLEEWKECRATIGRLDTTMADFRKNGFGFVTLLITAGGFLGRQSAPPKYGEAVTITIMLLIAVLFAVDRYYTLLLNGAVERALDIEGPEIDQENLSKDRLTQVISVHAVRSRTVFFIPLLYIGLLWATFLLASAMVGDASAKPLVCLWACIAFIVIYFSYTEWQSGTGSFGDRRTAAKPVGARPIEESGEANMPP